MSLRPLFGMVAAVAALVTTATAQVSPPQTQQLRQQIESLQEQLKQLEATDQDTRRSARIGSRPRAPMTATTLKLYDLGDLFAVAPAYPATQAGDLGAGGDYVFPLPGNVPGAPAGATGMGGFGGGGFFAIPAERPATVETHEDALRQASGTAGQSLTVKDLIAAIQSTVAPETWSTNGGPNTVATVGNALLISADDATHEQIGNLLDQFRERWGTLRTISVQAWWLWLGDEQLAALLEGDEAGGELRAFGLVNEQAWAEHMRQAGQGENPSPPGYRAAITCYNGQTVHVSAGEQSLTVTGIDPLVGYDEKTDTERAGGAYRPETAVIHDGAALQLTPIANVSGKTVVLDVHSRVAVITEPPQPPAADGPGRARTGGVAGPRDVVAAMDRPRLATQRLSTTLRIPAGRTMLLGGMTFSGLDREPPNLYLFARATVQELRNDREEEPQPRGVAAPRPEDAPTVD